MPDDLSIHLKKDIYLDEQIEFRQGEPRELAISSFRLRGKRDSFSPLEPGDRLQIMVSIEEVVTTLTVNIVDKPTIAPSPCVYTVLAESNVGTSVVLHATAPCPQRIEFPNLRRDLALGLVRRRALFVWRFASFDGNEIKKTKLIKFDRSGGAQLSDWQPLCELQKKENEPCPC